MDAISIWLFKELGRLVKGIGSALVIYAVWRETGKKPTRQQLREMERQQADVHQD
jgi:hypothetical protein